MESHGVLRHGAKETPAESLVVLLHGYGADASDLITLADDLTEALPRCEFVAIEAPQVCDVWAAGRQWFPLTERTPKEYRLGAEAAAPYLVSAVEKEMARVGVEPSSVALFGFSQGAMMALHVGLHYPKTFSGILAYSGALPAPDTLCREVASKPPVLLVHGEEDDVVPFWNLSVAQTAMENAEVPVTAQGLPGLGHGINVHGIELARTFLMEVFHES
ncbi:MULTISPECIES: alpha/beta hydrolase [Pseudovibrio]|uniref:alpha/beta hydrolase n=1 Tax=Stappiaceae TaxID=2821832 RepID=UPI002365C096|nr:MULTISPECIES: prolyl oligopeptidase family serine peptidase [Pseudovibrio]MDD7909432.1 prolyl oligopeptidase family serine peptidase [Pseudovibrio exalbescens]MDX5594991.1 prolyl oligopeptidase family serine peptidase [Pseudovibrio sp. SPO723]